MTDLSRRSILAGLLAAPVAVQAAVAAASNAIWCKAAAVIGSVRVAPVAHRAPMVHLADLGFAEFFDITAADGARYCGSTLGHPPPQPTEGDRLVRADFSQDGAGPAPHHFKRFTNGQWVKVEDEASKVAAIAQAEGHPPDLLDEDVATYCAVA